MNKPNGYDTTQPAQMGEFHNVPAGPYVLGIVKAEITKTKKTGAEMMVLTLDIAKGDDKNYYRALSLKLNRDCYMKYNQLTEGEKSVPYFKGMIKAIEESNSGYVFNFDENTLKGKFVGAMLREKRYYNQAGELKSILEIGFLCSVAKAESGELKLMPPIEPESRPQQQEQGNIQVDPNLEDLPF